MSDPLNDNVLLEYRTLAVNAAAAFAGRAAAIVLAVVLSTVLFRMLGAARYGIWSFCYTLVGYLALFDLGLGGSVERLVARAWTNRDAREVERVTNHAIASALGIGLALQALAFVVPVSVLNGIDVRALILALPACILCSLLSALTGGSLSGIQALPRLNALRTQMNAIGTALVLALALMGVRRLELLLLAYACGLAGVSVGAWLALRRAVGRLRLRPLCFDRDLAGEFARFGGTLQIAVFGPQLADQALRALLGARFGAAWMGCYDLGSRAALVLRSVAGGLMVAMVPFGVQQHLTGGTEALARLHRVTLKYTALLLLPASALLLLHSRWLIDLWLGTRPGTSEVLLVFRVYLVVHLVAGLGAPIAMLARAMGRPGPEALVLPIALACGLIASAVVPGAPATVSAFGAFSAAGACALWLILSKRDVGARRPWRDIGKAGAVASACALVSALLDRPFARAWPAYGWLVPLIRCTVSIAVPLLLAAPVAWAVGLVTGEECRFWRTQRFVADAVKDRQPSQSRSRVER